MQESISYAYGCVKKLLSSFKRQAPRIFLIENADIQQVKETGSADRKVNYYYCFRIKIIMQLGLPSSAGQPSLLGNGWCVWKSKINYEINFIASYVIN